MSAPLVGNVFHPRQTCKRPKYVMKHDVKKFAIILAIMSTNLCQGDCYRTYPSSLGSYMIS